VTADSLIALCGNLSDHLWLQGLLIVVVTGFLEDAARCGVGLLVSAGHIRWDVALVGMTTGGVVADVALYLLGRFATVLMLRRRWVDPERLSWAQGCFSRHAVQAIIIARFIPGIRMVTYLAAGTIRYPLPRFTFWLFIAALVQGVIFLQASDVIAQTILPYMHDKQMRFVVFGVIVLALLVANAFYLRHRRHVLKNGPAKTASPDAKKEDA